MSKYQNIPSHFASQQRYYALSHYLKKLFGQKVYKIILDAGFTCPNRDGTLAKGGCIYCNSFGSGSGQGRIPLKEQVMNGIQFVKERYGVQKFIVYFQAFTNTYASAHTLEKIYSSGLCHKDIVGMAIGTRPDCIDSEKLNMISQFTSDYEVFLEYGLESSHNHTLTLINRMDTWENFQKAVELSQKFSIKNIGTHLIMGLPGETQQDMLTTIHRVAQLNLHSIKIHSLYIEKNTSLEKFYNDYQFPLLTMEQYVSIVCDSLEILPSTIVIERLTGDPIGKYLYKPLWTAHKQKILLKIEQELLKRGSYQGCFSSPRISN